MLSGTLRIGDVAEAVDDHRILPLQDLRRHRAVGTETHGRDAVNSVLARPAAPSAKKQVHKGEMTAIGPCAAEMQHVSAFARDTDLVRQRLRQHSEYHVKDTEEERRAPPDCGWMTRINQSAFRRDYRDRPGKANIGQDIGADDTLDRTI